MAYESSTLFNFTTRSEKVKQSKADGWIIDWMDSGNRRHKVSEFQRYCQNLELKIDQAARRSRTGKGQLTDDAEDPVPP